MDSLAPRVPDQTSGHQIDLKPTLNTFSQRVAHFIDWQQALESHKRIKRSMSKTPTQTDFPSERSISKLHADQAEIRSVKARGRVDETDEKLQTMIWTLLEKQAQPRQSAEASGTQVASIQKAVEATMDKKIDQKYTEQETAMIGRLNQKASEIEAALTKRFTEKLTEQDSLLNRRFDEQESTMMDRLTEKLTEKLTEQEDLLSRRLIEKKGEQDAGLAKYYEQKLEEMNASIATRQGQQLAEQRDSIIQQFEKESQELTQSVTELRALLKYTNNANSDLSGQLSQLKEANNSSIAKLENRAASQNSELSEQLSQLREVVDSSMAKLEDRASSQEQKFSDVQSWKGQFEVDMAKLEDRTSSHEQRCSDQQSWKDQFEVELQEVRESRHRDAETSPAGSSVTTEQVEDMLLRHYKDLCKDIHKVELRVERLEQTTTRARSEPRPNQENHEATLAPTTAPAKGSMAEPEIRALISEQVKAETERRVKEWSDKWAHASLCLDQWCEKVRKEIAECRGEIDIKAEKLEKDIAASNDRVQGLEASFEQARETLEKTQADVESLKVEVGKVNTTNEEIDHRITHVTTWQNNFNSVNIAKQAAGFTSSLILPNVQAQLNSLAGRVAGLEHHFQPPLDPNSHKRRRVDTNSNVS